MLPTLAEAIGLNEAIILQQIHYWITTPRMGKQHDGKRWIYNSVREWQEMNFPFWSEATIKRALANLRAFGLVLTENLNEKTYDRTLWYTIDYDALNRLQQSIGSKCNNPLGQNAPMDEVKLHQPIPENTQRITRENSSDDYAAVVSAWENEMGYLVTPIIAGKLEDAIAEFGSDDVIRAIGVASAAGVRNWKYVEGIFRNVRERGWLDRPQGGNGSNKAVAVDDQYGGFSL